MESKNIFEMLPEQDSSEDEQKQKEKQKQKKQKERQDFQEKKKFAETQQKTIKGDAKKPAGYKSDQQKKQEKKISSDPHPLDRRSGTGRGKELKKQGGGAGNWGNTKDMVEEDKYVRKDETEQVESEEAKEEEKEALTLDDYMSKYKVEEKEEEKKKDIDLTQFIKEGCLVCLLYTSPSPRDRQKSRMPSSA
eukprot:TRINITY_DN1597_c0_g1_i2.p3 TRINITY_DN1597_c0_g1~~TRINITY_DN1597_c0_g1_i2.p3  ORF type:complete len:192 (-),score=55.15 TRINITY_DN1597_c0_g1_i2:22-597(-)